MSASDAGLNVIGLVSGGKDSFFSLLHCQANGHRIVALANLHPERSSMPATLDGTSSSPSPAAAPTASVAASLVPVLDPAGKVHSPDQDESPATTSPDHPSGPLANEAAPRQDEDESDLNSLMYQTVGHQVVPLYSEATGIPLYRRAITGRATQSGKEYSHYRRPTSSVTEAGAGPAPSPDNKEIGSGTQGSGQNSGHGAPGAELEEDETESMMPLLMRVKEEHPEANAICAGAILSTYQRTRVESVATRLGLTPLAYLWKFPVLPAPASLDPALGSDAQLLDDMAVAGLEARIIKVASGGLDESFLWTNVTSTAGKARLAKAMRRFGTAETGAIIGEGGEFETLVVDGPPSLFKKRIVVDEKDQKVVMEEGGTAWLSLRNARLESKDIENDSKPDIRIPDLLDPRFVGVLDTLLSPQTSEGTLSDQTYGDKQDIPSSLDLQRLKIAMSTLHEWGFVSDKPATIEQETQDLVEKIRQRLQETSLSPSAIISATILLRHMTDFPTVNRIYSSLFDAPNPPSRVTISCGDILSVTTKGSIAISLTVHTALQPGQRQGLHVQSRSYWAPANIGPYSQAITIPVMSLASAESLNDSTSSTGTLLVSIAGQIPLVPATMSLPAVPPNGSNLELQLTLSLQHLWRIGIEMGVCWWTSAVAFFPTSSSGEDMDLKVRLTARAWQRAHVAEDEDDGEEEDDDEDDGPDLWDRRYNPAYTTFASADEGGRKKGPSLPDRSVLSPTVPKGVVPPVFVAEVNELPRSASVEWHAHWGVAHAPEGAVKVTRDVLKAGSSATKCEENNQERQFFVSHVIISSNIETSGSSAPSEVVVVQTIVAERLVDTTAFTVFNPKSHAQIAKSSLSSLGIVSDKDLTLMMRYADVRALKSGAANESSVFGPLVPCRSLWDGAGERLVALSVFQSVYIKET